MIFNEGISRTGEIIDLAVEKNVVKKSGSWFSFGDERIGQGREKVKAALAENKELYQGIENKLLEELGLKEVEAETVES